MTIIKEHGLCCGCPACIVRDAVEQWILSGAVPGLVEIRTKRAEKLYARVLKEVMDKLLQNDPEYDDATR